MEGGGEEGRTLCPQGCGTMSSLAPLLGREMMQLGKFGSFLRHYADAHSPPQCLPKENGSIGPYRDSSTAVHDTCLSTAATGNNPSGPQWVTSSGVTTQQNTTHQPKRSNLLIPTTTGMKSQKPE